MPGLRYKEKRENAEVKACGYSMRRNLTQRKESRKPIGAPSALPVSSSSWRRSNSLSTSPLCGHTCSRFATSLLDFQLDNSITEEFLGYINAAYSLGGAISNPLFGYWSNRLGGHVRLPITTALCMMSLGNSLYFLVASLPVNAGWTMLLARFLTGCGSGKRRFDEAWSPQALWV